VLPYESTCSHASVNITNLKEKKKKRKTIFKIKEKKKKKKRNNDLANLPSHDKFLILLSCLLTSLIGLFSLACCFVVSLEVATLWGGWFLACCESRSKLMACEGGIKIYHKWCLPLSLHKYSVMGMRPAMALIPLDDEV